MIPYNYTEFIDGLTFLVKNNFIPMSRIDDAVRRILRIKFMMGLFENPLADYSMTKHLGSQVTWQCTRILDANPLLVDRENYEVEFHMFKLLT